MEVNFRSHNKNKVKNFLVSSIIVFITIATEPLQKKNKISLPISMHGSFNAPLYQIR